MGRRKQSVCEHCGGRFSADRYNYAVQRVCGSAACQRFLNASRQRRHREARGADAKASSTFKMKEAERARLNRAKKKESVSESKADAPQKLPLWLHTAEGVQAAFIGLLCQVSDCASVPDLVETAGALARRAARITGNTILSSSKTTSYVTGAEYDKPAYVTGAEHEKRLFQRT